MEMQASRPLYYFLVTVITQLVLAICALIVLIPTGLLTLLPLKILGLLMAYNVFIATFVAAIISGQQGQNERSIQQGAGLVVGHLVGLVLGGIVGAHYGGALGAMLSAVLFYFLVGQLGSRISLAIGAELERRARATYEPESRIQIRTTRTEHASLFFYGAVIPLAFMTAAMLVRNSGMAFAHFANVLSTARIILIALSMLSIAIPRLQRTQRVRREHIALLAGLALSLSPAVYGFLLFVAFGMSLAELSIFSVVASIAATTWGMRAARNS